MLFAGVAAMVRGIANVHEVPLQIEALEGSALSRDGRSLLTGKNADSGARLRAQLPQAAGDSGRRWMIWMPRSTVEGVWLQTPQWRSRQLDFFRPDNAEGALTSGFFFTLPESDSGAVDVQLRVRGQLKGVLTPRLVPEDERWLIITRTVAMNAFVYATLFMLALVALQLFVASRQGGFIALFASLMLGLLMIMLQNGHAYAVPGVNWFSYLRGQGLWAVELFFTASMVQLLTIYSVPADAEPGLVRGLRMLAWCLIGFGVFCLLFGGFFPARWMENMVTAGWVASTFWLVLLGVDALRRNVPMIGIVFAMGVAAGALMFVREALSRGYVPDHGWSRYGYQLQLMLVMGVVATALIARIAEYRRQRDDLRMAHRDVEQRLHRETALAEFSKALRTRLRNAASEQIESATMQVLMQHLQPLVPNDGLALVAGGFLGRDVLLVQPEQWRPQIRTQLARRQAELRNQTGNFLPQQRPARDKHGHEVVEATIPMRLRSPAWGALLIRRIGECGFTHYELTLVSQMLDMLVQQSIDTLTTLQLRRSAEIDALTGAFNRRTIDLWLGQVFRQAHHDDRPVSVLFADIDNFKNINDTYGHGCGDQCLRHVASILHQKVGQDGLLGRYGGEEFVILLPGYAAADAGDFAEQLRGAVQASPVHCDKQHVAATVSIGVACRGREENTPEGTLHRADRALYAAKRGGRNCVEVDSAAYA